MKLVRAIQLLEIEASLIEKRTCADGGSDIDLMPSNLYEDVLEKRAYMEVTAFDSPKTFGVAASDCNVLCHREVNIDTELHIRHGKTLMIRNLR